jgi:curved DNA-binding protein CbpA
MSKVNAFLMLGLNETVLGSVSDEDILALAQSQYRALSRIFHPDKGGDPVIFAMISEAYNSIQDEKVRREHLDDFLSSRADQLVRTQNELVELEKRRREDIDRVQDEHANFLADFVQAQQSEESTPLNSGDVTLVVQDNISDAELYTSLEDDRQFTEGFCIISRSDGRLTMTRLINTGSVVQATHTNYPSGMTKVSKKTKAYPLAGTWYRPGMESLEDMNQRAIAIEAEAEKLSPEKRKKLLDDASIPLSLLYTFEESEEEVLDFVLLGTLPEALVKHRTDSRQQPELQKMLAAPAGAKARQIIGKELSYDEFQSFLGEIKPSFNEGDFLVAARLQKGKLRFIVVGEILPHRSL